MKPMDFSPTVTGECPVENGSGDGDTAEQALSYKALSHDPEQSVATAIHRVVECSLLGLEMDVSTSEKV